MIREAKTVDPVTGKLRTAQHKGRQEDDLVQEGCLKIPRKYLRAAAEAGLGDQEGMYTHISALRRKKLNNVIKARPREIQKTKGQIKQFVQGRPRSFNAGVEREHKTGVVSFGSYNGKTYLKSAKTQGIGFKQAKVVPRDTNKKQRRKIAEKLGGTNITSKQQLREKRLLFLKMNKKN